MYWTAAGVIALALVMLSDSMILVLFIIPYIAYYSLFKRPEMPKGLLQKKAGSPFNGELFVMLNKHPPDLVESYRGYNVYYFNAAS